MGARLVMPAGHVERILARDRAIAFHARVEDGNGGDDLPFRQLALARDLLEHLGVDLYLARGRLPGITHWVGDVLLEGDGRGQLALPHALLEDLVPRGHLGIFGRSLLVDGADPFVLGLSGRELVLHAEAVGNLGVYVVDGTALEGRLLCRAADGDAPVVLGVAVGRHVELLGAHGVGKQYVGVLGRVRHEGVAHDDELALLLVGERLEDAVDVTVLVGDAVAGVVPEELDAVLGCLDLGGRGGCLGVLRAHEERELVGCVEFLLEVRAFGDALEPRIARYLGVDHVLGYAIGVVVGRRDGPDGCSRRLGLAHAGVRALAAEVAGQKREHAHRARGRLAVAVALQAPALHDVDAVGLV